MAISHVDLLLAKSSIIFRDDNRENKMLDSLTFLFIAITVRLFYRQILYRWTEAYSTVLSRSVALDDNRLNVSHQGGYISYLNLFFLLIFHSSFRLIVLLKCVAYSLSPNFVCRLQRHSCHQIIQISDVPKTHTII